MELLMPSPAQLDSDHMLFNQSGAIRAYIDGVLQNIHTPYALRCIVVGTSSLCLKINNFLSLLNGTRHTAGRYVGNGYEILGHGWNLNSNNTGLMAQRDSRNSFLIDDHSLFLPITKSLVRIGNLVPVHGVYTTYYAMTGEELGKPKLHEYGYFCWRLRTL